jgi:hypothetical protein
MLDSHYNDDAASNADESIIHHLLEEIIELLNMKTRL